MPQLWDRCECKPEGSTAAALPAGDLRGESVQSKSPRRQEALVVANDCVDSPPSHRTPRCTACAQLYERFAASGVHDTPARDTLSSPPLVSSNRTRLLSADRERKLFASSVAVPCESDDVYSYAQRQVHIITLVRDKGRAVSSLFVLCRRAFRCVVCTSA